MSKNIQELNDESLSQVTGGGFREKILSDSASASCEFLREQCYIEKTGSADMSKPISECDQLYQNCTNISKAPLNVR